MKSMNVKILESQLISQSKQNKQRVEPKKSFQEVIASLKDDEIKFSKHATLRMQSREMQLNKEEITRLKNAFEKAEEKGVKDALILMDGKVLITNVKSRTVITAFKSEQMEENVFTNIDGAVIG